MEIAERIRRIVAAHPLEVETSSGPAHTTISMGVACYPRDGLESSALVHQADLAVYRAKLQGRNRVLEAGTEPLVETVNSGSVVIPLPPAAPVAMSVPAGPASSVEAPGTTASTKPSSAADRAPIENSAVARAPRTDARSARPHEAPKPRLLALSLCLGLFVLPVTLVGVAAGSAGLAFGATRDFVGLVAVVALVGIGQSLALEVAEGSISVSAVGALAVAALFGFRAALALAVASAIVDWSARRSPLYQVLFNVGALSLASLAASGVFVAVHHLGAHSLVTAGAGLIGGAVYFTVNTGLLASAVAIEGRERAWRT